MKTFDFITGEIVSLIARNFRYNRFYTIINIGGLAAGLSCAIFILLFIQDELSYDRHHENRDRIYRLESDFTVNGRNTRAARTSYPFGPALTMMFPEIEAFCRFKPVEAMAIRYRKNDYFEKDLLFADSSVFDIFTHNFIYGTPCYALTEANSIVLTKSMSERYFGDEDPCGRYLELGNGTSCIVTAVIEDNPGNAHLQFDGLISMSTHAEIIGEEVFRDLETNQPWAFRLFTYILMKENTSIETIHDKFPEYYNLRMAELSQHFGGTFNLLSSRLTDIHLNSGLEWDFPTGDKDTILIFVAIGIFILIIAAINYMNLATARSAGKAREVGIRKISGAGRGHLLRLYLAESTVLSLLALLVALVLADLLLPLFNEISGKSIELTEALPGPAFLIILAITLIVGLISGSYPAFYLSSFRPVGAMQQKIYGGKRKGLLRKVLIVIQFFISILLIIGTITISQQLRHIKTADMGFDRDNLIIIPVTDTNAINSYPAFRDMLLGVPGVEGVTTAMFITGLTSAMDILRVEDTGDYARELIGVNFVNHNFVELMGFQIIRGRSFNIENRTDTENAVLINETAAQKLGWVEDPLGKEVAESARPEHFYKVIGVIKDFNYMPLHQKIGPMVFFLRDEPQSSIHIRLQPVFQAKTLSMIEHAWIKNNPRTPLSYVFLDHEIRSSYLHEEKLMQLMSMFTLFSIFIALLGLFGLSSYLTEQYTREIGIRKVFGASPFSVVYQLSTKYLVLVLLACILAMPVAWYLMDLWLENFAYRTDINIWWFINTAIGVIFISECTVIVQSLRAASKNPADTLRYE